jgi:hypothetical protein
MPSRTFDEAYLRAAGELPEVLERWSDLPEDEQSDLADALYSLFVRRDGLQRTLGSAWGAIEVLSALGAADLKFRVLAPRIQSVMGLRLENIAFLRFTPSRSVVSRAAPSYGQAGLPYAL